jgi:hypothetical protein
MEKTQLHGDRGLRRHRSFSKWMRRLKSDWNDHGWGRGLDGTYNCDCFCLDSKQAIRFKDTPKSCSGPCCGNPRRWYSGKKQSDEGELTLAERIVNIGEREFWSKRKRREGTYTARVQCRCGFVLGMREIPNGKSRWYLRSMFSRLCEGCAKNEKRKER